MSPRAAEGPAAAAVPWGVRVAVAWTWRAILLAVGVVLLARALGEVRLVVVPLAVALLLTTLLAPPARALRRLGLPAALAALAVLFTFLGAVGAAVLLLGPTVAGELDDLGVQLRGGAEEVLEWPTGLGLSREDLDRSLDQVAEQARQNAGGIGSGVLSGAVMAVELVAGSLLLVVLAFFLLKDGARMWDWLLGQVHPARAEALDELGRRLWRRLGAYARGVVVVAAFDAVFIGLALWVIGVPLVLPLAVLTFFTAFIPIVGAFAAGAAAVLVALVSGGPQDAALTLLAVIAVQQIESQLLQPVVVGRSVRIHPAIILLVVTAGGILAGIPGAMLATPVLAVAVTAAGYLREREPPAEGAFP